MQPRKAHPRKNHFTITVTDSDREAIRKAAEKAGMSDSTWARNILLRSLTKRKQG